jgi:5-methylcytosine-specific restriction endonuclease McrA
VRQSISKALRFKVFQRDGFRCVYCGAAPPDALLHVDHVLAVARDGEHALRNFATACSDCNVGKGASPLETLPPVLNEREAARDFAELFGFDRDDERAVAECVRLIAETDAAMESRA